MCARGGTRRGRSEAWLQLEHMLCPAPPHRPAKQTVLITRSLQRGEVRAEGLGQREARRRTPGCLRLCFSNPAVVLLFPMPPPEKPGVTGGGGPGGCLSGSLEPPSLALPLVRAGGILPNP